MLLINGLKFTTQPKSFSDFDNMFKAIDSDSDTIFYTATLVYNKVLLGCGSTRSNEAKAWLREKWCQQHQHNQQQILLDNTDCVSDIED